MLEITYANEHFHIVGSLGIPTTIFGMNLFFKMKV